LRPAPVAKYAPRVERHQSRVLLAEDNETIISALSDYLNAEGYEIILARNGREAVTRAIELRPDAILMDVQMPGMDGLEATRLIRAETGGRAGGPRPYIIAMTANAMPGDREMCLEAGMDDYISKPVHIEELQTALKQAGIRLAARVTPPSIEAQAV
jgi:CheY-like chemotaxis protein